MHWIILGLFHPVVWIGKLIDAIQSHLKKMFTYAQSKISGCILVLIVVGSAVLGGYLVTLVHGFIGLLISAYVLKSTFSITCLTNTATKICEHLEKDDLVSAKKKLPALVGRDPEGLTKEGMCSAVIAVANILLRALRVAGGIRVQGNKYSGFPRFIPFCSENIKTGSWTDYEPEFWMANGCDGWGIEHIPEKAAVLYHGKRVCIAGAATDKRGNSNNEGVIYDYHRIIFLHPLLHKTAAGVKRSK